MAHDGCDDAPAHQVDGAPEGAQNRGGQHGIPPLQAVAESENQAVEHQPHPSASKMLLEPVEDERALDFFAQTSADRRDDREHQRLHRGLNQLLKRILFHVVERREEQTCGRQNYHGKRELRRDARAQRNLEERVGTGSGDIARCGPGERLIRSGFQTLNFTLPLKPQRLVRCILEATEAAILRST